MSAILYSTVLPVTCFITHVLNTLVFYSFLRFQVIIDFLLGASLIIQGFIDHILCDTTEYITSEERDASILNKIVSPIAFTRALLVVYHYWFYTQHKQATKFAMVTSFVIIVFYLGFYVPGASRIPGSQYCHRNELGLITDTFAVHIVGLLLSFSMLNSISDEYYKSKQKNKKDS